MHVLRFIKRARTLGFSVEETATLLAPLAGQVPAPAPRSRTLPRGHIAALETKIAELQGMVKTLKHLAHCCGGDNRPDCPILDDLAGEHPTSKGH